MKTIKRNYCATSCGLRVDLKHWKRAMGVRDKYPALWDGAVYFPHARETVRALLKAARVDVEPSGASFHPVRP